MPTNFTSVAYGQTTKTASFTADGDNAIYFCDATGGAITVTLPSAADYAGVRLVFKKTDASANAVTVNTADGGAVGLAAQYNSVEVASNGTAWFKV
jgi:hypothetical protein